MPRPASHLGSKGTAFEVALAVGLDEVIEGVPRFQQDYGVGRGKAFAEYYLSKEHRMPKIAGLVAQRLAGGSDEDRRARAWSMLGILIGGINLARAMKSAAASEEVSEAIKTAAIKAAGRTRTIASD